MRLDFSDPGVLAALGGSLVFLLGVIFIYRLHRDKGIAGSDDMFDRYIERQTLVLRRSDAPFSIKTYVIMQASIPVAFAIFGYVASGQPVMLFILFLFGLRIPDLIVKVFAERAAKDFNRKFEESLSILATSLKAGLSLTQAVETVRDSSTLNRSMRERYARLSASLAVGIPIRDAFRQFAEETPSQAARDMALAVDLQNEVGGRETEAIETIAQEIRAQISTKRKVDSIFGSTSSMLLMFDIMPEGMMIAYLFVYPDSKAVYFSMPALTVLLVVLLLIPIIGSFVTHSIVDGIRRRL